MSSISRSEWLPNVGSRSREESSGLSFVRTLNVLRRRKWMILAIVALITTAAYWILSQLPPRYMAEAVIMIEYRRPQFMDSKSDGPQVALDASAIRTEAEVLRSLGLAKKVAESLDLRSSREFGPKSSRLALIMHGLGLESMSRASPDNGASRMPASAGGASRTGPMSGAKKPELGIIENARNNAAPGDKGLPSLEDVVVQLRNNLGVSNDGRSSVIKVRYETADPRLAASIVNTYAKTYIEEQLAAKSQALVRASILLAGRVEELRRTAGDSDRAVQVFRDENRLTEARGMTVTAQQLAELNTQLTLATSERAQKEASLQQLETKIASGEGPEGALEILNSPVILRLKEQQTEVLRQEAERLAQYGDQHPEVMKIKAEQQQIADRLSREMKYLVLGLKNEVSAARAREAALRGDLTVVQDRAHELDRAQVQLRELEREANANRDLYQHFLMRSKEVSAQKDFQEADARILSEALVPRQPTFPQTSRILGLALVTSLFAAVAFAFVLEQFDYTFISADELEKESDMPSFGSVPELRQGISGPKTIAEYPTSSFSEAIRSVRTSLELATTNNPKLILVTSSLGREGKSTFAASLASSAAHSGSSTLLIDCDLRLGSVGKQFGTTGNPGLEGFLKGEKNVSDIVQTESSSGLHYIPALSGSANPQALLGSETMKSLLGVVRNSYDLVILDAPPVLPVSDALVLAKLADATIFVVKWNSTPRSSAVKALRELRKVGANVVGLVLYRVNLRRSASHGFGAVELSYYGADPALRRIGQTEKAG